VTAAAPVTLMGSGFGVHVTPGGSPAAGHVTFTLPVKPPVGVTVMVDGPLAPAVAVTAVPAMVNEPVLPLPMVPVKEKFKTLLPPKARGSGSKAPNELTMM